MQEIAPKFFIESNYPGVTVAGTSWSHGMILIDAPLRQEDTRTWRSSLLALRPPEITFNQSLQMHSDENEIQIESRPASASGAIWVSFKKEGVVFLGDAVVVDQPPFLAGGDLPEWIKNLIELTTPAYKNRILVSGRGGIINQEKVKAQIKFLEKADTGLRSLSNHPAATAEIDKLSNSLLKSFHIPAGKEKMFSHRLRWGLQQVYQRHYSPAGGHPLE